MLKGKTYGKKFTTYALTPNEIEKMLGYWVFNTYGYAPELEVQFDTQIWLPVEVSFVEEDTEEYRVFWDNFTTDLSQIKDKHPDFEFTLGDKLLQMYFGKNISHYVFNHDDYESEFITYDNGTVYIMIDEEMEIEFVSDEEAAKQKYRIPREDMLSAIVSETNPELVRDYILKGYETDEAVIAGMCIIHVAVDAKKYDVVEVILEETEDVNLPDLGHGYTPLAYAVLNNDLKMAELLLNYGADTETVSRNGKTAMELASMIEMEKLLAQYI